MTYIEAVNQLLVRLRERKVSTVTETEYSSLLGELLNDALQEIENAYDWSAFRTTLSGITSEGIFNYELNDSGQRFTFLNAYVDTTDTPLKYISQHKMTELHRMRPVQYGPPQYFTWNGVSNVDLDTQVDLYPIPDGTYTLRFNIVQRQPRMTLDNDQLGLPDLPVLQLAYAKAIEERGEDAGVSSSSAYATARNSLSDAIQLDAWKHPEEMIYAVT